RRDPWQRHLVPCLRRELCVPGRGSARRCALQSQEADRLLCSCEFLGRLSIFARSRGVSGMAKQTIQRVDKPWGHELIWAKTLDYVGKILHIKKGHKLLLQYDREKVESILVHSGEILYVFENEQGQLTEIPLKAGEAHHIP